MLPGRDGSTAVPRAQAERYEVPSRLSAEDKEHLKETLVEVLSSYVRTSMTQEMVSDILRVLRCSRLVNAHMRPAIPATFKQLLSALEQLKCPVLGHTYDYDMCPCGFLYRWACFHV